MGDSHQRGFAIVCVLVLCVVGILASACTWPGKELGNGAREPASDDRNASDNDAASDVAFPILVQYPIWHIMDESGDLLVEVEAADVGRYSDGLAVFMSTDLTHQQSGVIDTTGAVVVQPEFDSIGTFRDGLAPAAKDGKAGLIDRDGAWALETSFEWVGQLSEGLAPASVDGEYGFIDATGEWVIAPQYVEAGEFVEGLALALDADYMRGHAGEPIIEGHDHGKWGYIDQEGEWAIDPTFDAAGDFSDGLAPAWEATQGWGYIDTAGSWAIEPTFRYAEGFSGGLAAVVDHDERWGYIDTDGEWAVEPKFALAGSFADGVALVHLDDGRSGYVYPDGSWFIEPTGESSEL